MGNVRDFGAVGDGTTDDTEAIEHAIRDGNGQLEFPRGDYLIRRTLLIDLQKRSRSSLTGFGGVGKIIMAGSGLWIQS